MSRILRRPMFRGGSTSNEGIMSVPRKGYQRAYGVQILMYLMVVQTDRWWSLLESDEQLLLIQLELQFQIQELI
jgi:hypothetical protein